MSIVGTRPPLISETNLYEPRHKARLAIKPGITGMWQVSGRSDITDFEEVVRLDKEYIENWDIGLYDAGYVGVVIFVIFMAILSQKIYLKAIRSSKVKNDWIDLNVLAYSYMYYTILFSFFSNKFYEEIFSPRFLYYLVWWIALKFLCELKLKTRGRLSEN